ncbi:MAG: hypothetical protein FWC91_04355 [Defluviitaleaceae bacterium]|nr:hypothetical protein [Defluviitaleaceae bacterium]
MEKSKLSRILEDCLYVLALITILLVITAGSFMFFTVQVSASTSGLRWVRGNTTSDTHATPTAWWDTRNAYIPPGAQVHFRHVCQRDSRFAIIQWNGRELRIYRRSLTDNMHGSHAGYRRNIGQRRIVGNSDSGVNGAVLRTRLSSANIGRTLPIGTSVHVYYTIRPFGWYGEIWAYAHCSRNGHGWIRASRLRHP